MDMYMAAEQTSATSNPIWDVAVRGGVVPIITGLEEEKQKAILASFIEKGTIPLLPDAGVPWVKYLTGEDKNFGELDVAIRDSLQKAGAENWYPQYEIDGDRLTMTVGKEQ